MLEELNVRADRVDLAIGDLVFFFFKQKTAYEMCGRDWSSDVCSSDLSQDFQWIGDGACGND